MRKKAIARAIAQGANDNRWDIVALWGVGLWVAALLYLLATFDPIH